MNYELWSATSKNLIQTFEGRDLALAEVRTIVGRRGKAYAERLVLVGEDDQGASVRIAAGSDLVRLAIEDGPVASSVDGVLSQIG